MFQNFYQLYTTMDAASAIEKVKACLLQGSTVYTVRTNHGARAKKSFLVLMVERSSIEDITWLVSAATKTKRGNRGDIACEDPDTLIALLSNRVYGDHRAIKGIHIG